jgi:DNA-binding NarL/FixJ family response regulator
VNGGPIRVVVVDDVDVMRALVRRVLDRDGRFVVVSEAADGRAAIDETRRHQPDLVVLDLAMPVLDGLSALPELRAVCPAARIVVLTGFAETAMGAAARAAGAVAYLEKGGDLGALVTNLAALGRGFDTTATASDVVEATLAASSTTPVEARRLVGTAVRAWACDDVLDSVMLCTSEIVTNAAHHAGGEVRVTAELLPASIRVSTTDTEPALPIAQPALATDAAGRGLRVVDRLADRWGIVPQPDGKLVWFEVARPDVGATDAELADDPVDDTADGLVPRRPAVRPTP